MFELWSPNMSATRPRLKHPVRWNCCRGLVFAAVFVVLVVAPVQSVNDDAGASTPNSAPTATPRTASTRQVSVYGYNTSTSIAATALPTVEPATATVSSVASNTKSTIAYSTATNPAIASGPTTDAVTTRAYTQQNSNDSTITRPDTDAPGSSTTGPTTTDLISSTPSATGPISDTTAGSANEGTSQQQTGNVTTPGGLSDGIKAVIGVSVSVLAAALLSIAVYMIIQKRLRMHADYATNYEVLFEESDS